MNNHTDISKEYASKINKLHAISHISFYLVSTKKGPVFSRPTINDTPYFSHWYQTKIDHYLTKEMPPYMPYLIDIGDNIISALMKLDSEYYLFLGPILSKELDYQEFYVIHKDILPNAEIRRMYDLICQNPLMNIYHFSNILSVCVDLFFHENIDYSEIILYNYGSDEVKQPSSSFTYQNYTSHTYNHANVLEFEYRTQNAILAGDMDALKEAFHHPTRLHAQDLHLTESLYNLVSFTSFGTLMSRTAIIGGVPASESLSLLDGYVKRVMEITDSDEMFTLLLQLSTDYCQMVNQEKNMPYHSVIIRNCTKYISKNLYQKITEEDLAEICHVSTRTISRHFKEHLNMSVSDYINQEKLREAAFLLTGTNDSISEISSSLQFSSQGYFTTLFQKKYQTTPQRFRKNYQNR